MADIFNDILAKGIRAGKAPGRTEDAKTWFRDTAKKLRNITETKLLRDASAKTNRVEVGSMYFFTYDAKTKEKLPYFDRFPLVFPISATDDGFIGLNLHYLPYVLRANLMDALYTYTSNPNLDDKTKLRISYQILKGSSANKFIKPCIKRYLSSHVTSNFVFISPAEWDVALFLPVQNFMYASSRTVWRDSENMMRS